MSDMEDDVLMLYLESFRKLEHLEERAALVEIVWRKLDVLVRAMAKHPEMMKVLEPEMLQLKSAVVAVLTFDEGKKV